MKVEAEGQKAMQANKQVMVTFSKPTNGTWTEEKFKKWTEKWAKINIRQFTGKKNKMALNHMKRHSASHVRETLTKTTLRCLSHLPDW